MITETNYVEEAEKAIQKLKSQKNEKTGRPLEMVTTSKIRNLLSMTADIYNEVVCCNDDKLSVDIVSRIEYLKVRFLYDAGREPSVKRFIETANVLEVLDTIKGSKKNYILFNRYMEALVAYHKYFGGKD